MTRYPWFRLYDEIIDDPKLMKLSPGERWEFIEILCCINKENRKTGRVPSEADLTFYLRRSPEVIREQCENLLRAGLIKKDKHGYFSQTFGGRNFSSDLSTDRVKRFRNGQRNVSETLDETLDETLKNRTEQNIHNTTTHRPDSNLERGNKSNNEVAQSANEFVNALAQKKTGKKAKKEESYFMDLLKAIGIPGDVALQYTQRYPLEYLARKIVSLEYAINYNGTKIESPVAWLRSTIEHDYSEPEDYHTWRKQKSESLMNSDKTEDHILGGYIA